MLPPVCCYSLVSATNDKPFLLTAPATVVHVPGADHVTVKTLLPLRRRRFPSVTNATICVVAKEQSVASSSSSVQDVPVVIGSWCRRDRVVAGLQSLVKAQSADGTRHPCTVVCRSGVTFSRGHAVAATPSSPCGLRQCRSCSCRPVDQSCLCPPAVTCQVQLPVIRGGCRRPVRSRADGVLAVAAVHSGHAVAHACRSGRCFDASRSVQTYIRVTRSSEQSTASRPSCRHAQNCHPAQSVWFVNSGYTYTSMVYVLCVYDDYVFANHSICFNCYDICAQLCYFFESLFDDYL